MRAQSSATASSSIAVPRLGPAGRQAPPPRRWLGSALAGLGVLCFSFTFPATRWSLAGFPPWTAVTLRCAVAALVAGACLVAARAPLPPRRDWPGLLAVAAGCVLGFPLLSTLALRTTSTSHAAVVIGLLPIATAAVGALRTGARPSAPFWAAAATGAVAVAGFALLSSGGTPSGGDVYLFVALVICAVGYAEGGRLARSMPGWQVIAWALAAAAPLTVPGAALALAAEPVHPGGRALLGLGYTALVSQFGGFVAWYRGMSLVGVARASQLQLAQPLLTVGWSALLFGEAVGVAAPLTAVVVLVCVAVTQRARS